MGKVGVEGIFSGNLGGNAPTFSRVNVEFLSCIMSAHSAQYFLIFMFLFETFEVLSGRCRIAGTD